MEYVGGVLITKLLGSEGFLSGVLTLNILWNSRILYQLVTIIINHLGSMLSLPYDGYTTSSSLSYVQYNNIHNN